MEPPRSADPDASAAALPNLAGDPPRPSTATSANRAVSQARPIARPTAVSLTSWHPRSSRCSPTDFGPTIPAGRAAIAQRSWLDETVASSHFGLCRRDIADRFNSRRVSLDEPPAAGRQWPALSAGAVVPLTARHLQIVAMLADGLRADEIADELGIAASTVYKYVKQAKDRASVNTRGELVAFAVREGFLLRGQ